MLRSADMSNTIPDEKVYFVTITTNFRTMKTYNSVDFREESLKATTKLLNFVELCLNLPVIFIICIIIVVTWSLIGSNILSSRKTKFIQTPWNTLTDYVLFLFDFISTTHLHTGCDHLRILLMLKAVEYSKRNTCSSHHTTCLEKTQIGKNARCLPG